MEPCRSRKPKPRLAAVAVVVVLLLLLGLRPASGVPASRSNSMQLRNQQHPPSLELSSLQEMVAASGKQLQGRAMTERMAVEVNDYPGSGANNRHDPPKGPGRG